RLCFVACVAVMPPPRPTRFPYTTLFRSRLVGTLPGAGSRRCRSVHLQGPAPSLRGTPRRGDRHPLPHARTRSRRRHGVAPPGRLDRKSTRLNSSHVKISYAVFCLKKKRV